MVVISDMEHIPKSCYDCDFHNYHFCDMTGNCIEQNIDDGTRAEDCPLKEVSNNKFISMQEAMEQLGITAEDVDNAEDLEFTVEPLFDKSVLEDIKAEIEKIYNRENNTFDCLNALDELREFIDKHISGNEK